MSPARRTDPVVNGPASIPVAEGEEPWTQEELTEIREELTGEVARLERAIAVAQAELEARGQLRLGNIDPDTGEIAP
mgnify:CR=1 FL=1